MHNTQGKLLLIAGLPGSGKSHWMATHTPDSDFFLADDFMAHAYGDIGKFAYSRWYFPLIFALRSGRDAAISDIAFCDAGRRVEAERVLKDAVDGLDCRWIFFEHAPDACRQNIERDARAKGRASESRLQALDNWSRRYCVPPGAKVERVFREGNNEGAQQTRCSEPGDVALVCDLTPVPPGH